jgi:hypothetical protein
MIIDEQNEFADATSVALAAGTHLIGDVIDLGRAGDDIGNGEPLYLIGTVDTSVITGGTAGTIKFQLASDAQAAIATDGSASIHFETKTFVTDDDALNDLDAGDVIICIALPNGAGVEYERYLGILAVVGTTTITAGKVNFFLSKDPQRWKPYADATN